jgi:hypothetical protein
MASINKQKGVSLYLAIVIMIIVLGIALGMATISYKQIKGAQETGNSVLAFFAADTGMERALKTIINDGETGIGAFGGLGATGTLSNTANYSVKIECCSSTDPNCNFSPPIACGGGGTGENCPIGLSEIATCISPKYCVKSQGVYKGIQRAVEVGYGAPSTTGGSQLYEYSGPGDIGSQLGGFGGAVWTGQSFTVGQVGPMGDFTPTLVKFRVTANPSPGFTVHIRAVDIGGYPDSVDLCSGAGESGDVGVVLNCTGVVLVSGTKYAIVIERAGMFSIRITDPANSYASASAFRSPDSGINWNLTGAMGNDLWFEIWGCPSP